MLLETIAVVLDAGKLFRNHIWFMDDGSFLLKSMIIMLGPLAAFESNRILFDGLIARSSKPEGERKQSLHSGVRESTYRKSFFF